MYISTFQGLGPSDLWAPARGPLNAGAARGSARFPFDAPHATYYRARNAIYHLFKALVRENSRLSVLMPDYNSGNEVLAVEAAGAAIHYYPIGADGQADSREVERLSAIHRPDVLYVIHYLGWPQPMAELSSLCRDRGMWMMEDCALALLSDANTRPLGTFGDWSVFCLYKTLPLPNGACLVQNSDAVPPMDMIPQRNAGLPSVLGRTTELMVRRLRSRNESLGAAVATVKRAAGRAAGAIDVQRAPVGDIGFNPAEIDLAMSEVSERLLRRLDFDDIRQRRIENYRSLDDQLPRHVRRLHEDLPEGACPLFFPILVDDKPGTADALRGQGIDALQFWNHGADPTRLGSCPNTRFLREHVLGIPIHQDLNARQIEYVAHVVGNLAGRRAH
jgi:dTDP-4-amino-4,6-dideoxygalactose transaminase